MKIVNNLIIYLCGDSVTVIYVDNKIGLCISLESQDKKTPLRLNENTRAFEIKRRRVLNKT